MRELPPARRDAAVRLVVDRIRRLRDDRSRRDAPTESVDRQLDLEDLLRAAQKAP